jgi:hypothetical protein
MHAGGRYYRHSGEFEVGGAVGMLAVGGAAGLACGAVYGYADAYIPFIYVMFLLTLGAGGLTGYVTALVARRGNVRNPVLNGIAGGLVGFVALYASWVAWIHAILGFRVLVLSPMGILRVMSVVAQEGAWEVFDTTPTGATLYAIWGVEAAVVIGASAYMAWSHLAGWPFCERCQTWTDPSKGFGPFESIAAPEEFRSRLEREDYTALVELVAAEDDANEFSSTEVWSCPECREVSFLTITNVKTTNEKKGEEEETETESSYVVRILIVPSDICDKLAAAEKKVCEIAGDATPEGPGGADRT